METTYGDEQAAITRRLDQYWGDRTPVVWPNSARKPEGQAHLEVRIINSEAFNNAMSAVQQEIRHPGLLRVHVRVPLGSGDGNARDYGDVICDAFRNVTFDRITFRAPTLRDLGRDGAWHHVQVDCPFHRDSIITE